MQAQVKLALGSLTGLLQAVEFCSFSPLTCMGGVGSISDLLCGTIEHLESLLDCLLLYPRIQRLLVRTLYAFLSSSE